MSVTPVPSDGIDGFLADMARDLERGFVPLKVFNNRQIYDLELRRVFGRSWVFIGHETELPNPGDFALRNIGEDPFILDRKSVV